MSDTIAVVENGRVTEEAYEMGYERFEDAEIEDGEVGPVWFENFTETAEYANCVLPALRAMAGFDDAGYGTFQTERTVALVEEGDEDDSPIEATKTTSAIVFDRLVDEYRRGAYDAVSQD